MAQDTQSRDSRQETTAQTRETMKGDGMKTDRKTTVEDCPRHDYAYRVDLDGSI